MKKRILHIVGDSKYGGGSVIIIRLALAAMEAGFEVDVLATDPVFQNALKASGIGVVSLDCIWRDIRPFRDVLGLLRLRRYLVAHHYDIVHTHTSKAGFVGRAAAWRAKAPAIVHTVHGFAFHEESSWAALRAYAFLERRAAHWCHRLVTVSLFHRQWALDLGIGDPERVVAISNGISAARLAQSRSSEAVRKELGIAPGAVVVMVPGRLAPQKGLEYLVEAFALLIRRGQRDVVLVIVGDGVLREPLQQQSRALGIDARVVFAGYREDIGDVVSASDYIVLPSLREGLSIALLEAMAAGKPIVTTSIGSNLEATDNGRVARIVPPKDAVALADSMEYLLQHPDVAGELGRAAQERFEACYTEKRMLDAYLSLYHDLLDERRNT